MNERSFILALFALQLAALSAIALATGSWREIAAVMAVYGGLGIAMSFYVLRTIQERRLGIAG